jgi:heat shock protein HslJ
VDPAQIILGSCVNLTWSVNGTVDNVRISRDGAVILDGGSLTGSAQDCPTATGQVGYQLVASNNSGQSDTQAATVIVEAPPQGNPLENTNWKLLSYNNGTGGMQSVLAGTEVNLSFQADLVAKGSAGCNTYQSPYTVSGSQLSMSQPIVTLLNCGEPPGIMDQENAYLALLRQTATFEIEGNELRLYDNQNKLLLEFENMIQPR